MDYKFTMGLIFKKKQTRDIDGKLIKDTGGFCCMWSFLQMDFRLKNPELPPNELANRLVKMIKGDPEEFFRNYKIDMINILRINVNLISG